MRVDTFFMVSLPRFFPRKYKRSSLSFEYPIENSAFEVFGQTILNTGTTGAPCRLPQGCLISSAISFLRSPTKVRNLPNQIQIPLTLSPSFRDTRFRRFRAGGGVSARIFLPIRIHIQEKVRKNICVQHMLFLRTLQVQRKHYAASFIHAADLCRNYKLRLFGRHGKRNGEIALKSHAAMR